MNKQIIILKILIKPKNMEVNTIPLSEAEKQAQIKYNKEHESNIDGIILKAFEFFYSIAKEKKINEDDINRFQSGFNKKQLKKIGKVTGDIQ